MKTILLVIAISSTLFFAAKEYKYKCVRSSQIYTFSRQGTYRCPQHPEHNLILTN